MTESLLVSFKPHELRMVMEGLYTARDQLRPAWGEGQIKNTLYYMAMSFGLPRTQGLMPEIYQYIFAK